MSDLTLEDASIRREAKPVSCGVGPPRRRLPAAPLVHFACLVLLVSGCGGRSAEYWMGKLDNEPSEEQSEAALALGRMGADAKVSVPKLVKLLKGGDVQGRWSAATALGQMGAAAQEAVPALKEALQDENGDVRDAAARALERIERAAKHPKKPS